MPRSLRRRCNFVVNSSTFTSHCSTTFTLSRAHVLFSSTICYTFNTRVCISSRLLEIQTRICEIKSRIFHLDDSSLFLFFFSTSFIFQRFQIFLSRGRGERERESFSFFFFTWTLEGGALIETRRGGSCRSFPS